MTAPLVITRDQSLLDELLRLAAAAGATPDVAGDVPTALRAWARAPLVLVGEDLAPSLARAAPSRRDRVFVVLTAPVPDRVFQVALSLGAESVAEYYALELEVFPGSDRLLIPVRLRAGVSGGGLGLGFELIGVDRVVEAAFLDAVARVETETGRPVYRAELAK